MAFYVNNVTDKKQSVVYCSICGGNRFNPIPLNKLDRLLRFLSFGKLAASKVECTYCKQTMLLPASKKK